MTASTPTIWTVELSRSEDTFEVTAHQADVNPMIARFYDENGNLVAAVTGWRAVTRQRTEP